MNRLAGSSCLSGSSFIGDSITQGQTSLRYMQEYNQSVPQRLQLLQVTSSPALQSVNEGLSADNSLHKTQDNIKVKVSQNEQAFNTALLRYSNLYKSYADSVLQHSQNAGEIAARAQLQTQLTQTNDDLIHYAEAISADMGQIRVTDQNLRREIEKQQDHLHHYIQSLAIERKRIENSHYGLTTAFGQNEDSGLVYNSRRAHYIVWSLLTMAIVALTLHYILSGATSSLFVVLFLMVIYLVAKAIGG